MFGLLTLIGLDFYDFISQFLRYHIEVGYKYSVTGRIFNFHFSVWKYGQTSSLVFDKFIYELILTRLVCCNKGQIVFVSFIFLLKG